MVLTQMGLTSFIVLKSNKQELKDLEKYVKRYSHSIFLISKTKLAAFL